MRVCLVLEGSYPYVHGGVSTWMHNYILQAPDVEFVLWTIGAQAESRGKYVYELPENVVEVHEVFLDDAQRVDGVGRVWGQGARLSERQRKAVRQLVLCGSPDWIVLRRLVRSDPEHPEGLLGSEAFLQVLVDLCREQFPNVPFSQAYYTVRSMAMPVLYLLAQDMPQADLYHAISTGYAGLLAGLAHLETGKPFVLTEHGIYSREREEEIIRAEWVLPYFKRRWISFFYMLSSVAYANATFVTSLFTAARDTQVELGAPRERCVVIGNGVDYERFAAVPPKPDDGWVDIGAPVRMAPIKDIKTMIHAFYELRQQVSNVRLHILGGVDDQDYADECHRLVETLGVEGIDFPGLVNMVEYMAKLDFTVLSSISEGQPLSELESFSAGRPMVTTDVGSCRELAEGAPDDKLGVAALVVAPMDHSAMAEAMRTLCEHPDLRRKMGAVGQARVRAHYRKEDMMKAYRDVYRRALGEGV